ncbi:MAG: hypothetical protein EOO29_05180 [Comamonadaceae bacterium]|nr:MAG: hypothetical protein EOO29_05180 [Comamonadaceae bacterium]
MRFAPDPCRVSPLSAVALVLLLTACASSKRPPVAAVPAPAAEAAAPAAAPAPASEPAAQVGALHPVAVERIDSTQRVRIEKGQRCGPRITRTLPPPSTMGRMAGWIGLGGPSAGELPAPDFQTEVVCQDMAVRHYEPAQYRATYHVGQEAHTVDVPQRPGLTIQVDEAGLPPGAPRPPAAALTEPTAEPTTPPTAQPLAAPP